MVDDEYKKSESIRGSCRREVEMKVVERAKSGSTEQSSKRVFKAFCVFVNFHHLRLSVRPCFSLICLTLSLGLSTQNTRIAIAYVHA